jgi:hypothetical protein
MPGDPDEMRSHRIFLASFLDGYTSAFRLFDKVERPGSSSAMLDEMTTPDELAAFAKTHPTAIGLLLDLKEKEHSRDAAYAMLFRINGAICLASTIAALCFVALKW